MSWFYFMLYNWLIAERGIIIMPGKAKGINKGVKQKNKAPKVSKKPKKKPAKIRRAAY